MNCPECGKPVGYQQTFCREACEANYFASDECVFTADSPVEEPTEVINLVSKNRGETMGILQECSPNELRRLIQVGHPCNKLATLTLSEHSRSE